MTCLAHIPVAVCATAPRTYEPYTKRARGKIDEQVVDDLSIGLRGAATLDAITAIADATDPATLRTPVEPRRLDAIKFASCVPDAALQRMISERDADESAVARVLREPIRLASR